MPDADPVPLTGDTVVPVVEGGAARSSESADEPVQHVSVKPPAFMESAVQGWFAIMQAQFHLSKITNNNTRFYHVLAALPPTTVSKLNTAALSSNDYETLKTAVCALYEKSKSELFDQLISKVVLTGRPSLFVRELQDLASKVGVGDDLVRHKLLQSLPPTVGAVLTAQRDLTLSQLGKLADELMPLLQTACFSASAQPSRTPPPGPGPQQHQRDHHPAARTGGPSRDGPSPAASSVPRGLQPFYRDQRPQVCRAHLYFGQEARTCKPWCRWPKKGDAKMEPSSRRGSPQRQGN